MIFCGKRYRLLYGSMYLFKEVNGNWRDKKIQATIYPIDKDDLEQHVFI